MARTPTFVCRCEHSPAATIRSRVIEGGRLVYQNQCHACGGSLGDHLQQAAVRRMLSGAEPPPWDESLSFGDRENLAGRYSEYLRSDEWREKRRLVFDRCGGVCEGCRNDSAVQVHHLTYENIGREFLWQLVGVCRSCHERAHGRDPDPGDEDFPW